MNSHTQLTKTRNRLAHHIGRLLLLVALSALSIGGQVKRPDPPTGQQPNPKTQNIPGKPDGPKELDTSSFPPMKDPQIAEFDSLPKELQQARLETKGPLLPQKYSTSNFSMRVFLKGDSPVLLDFSLQFGAAAIVTFQVEGAAPFRYGLMSVGTDFDGSTNQRLLNRRGRSPDERGNELIAIIGEYFLRNIEKGRQTEVIRLPSSFGDTPQVGSISIQAYTGDFDRPQPAFFRLYALAIGDHAMSAMLPTTQRDLTKTHHLLNNAMAQAGPRKPKIDGIKLNPGAFTPGRDRGVTYEFRSRAAYYNVAAVFNREEDLANISYINTVNYQNLGGVTEGAVVKPTRDRPCKWDGRSEGAVSRGWHSLEIRAWQNAGDRESLTARSYPKRVLVR